MTGMAPLHARLSGSEPREVGGRRAFGMRPHASYERKRAARAKPLTRRARVSNFAVRPPRQGAAPPGASCPNRPPKPWRPVSPPVQTDPWAGRASWIVVCFFGFIVTFRRNRKERFVNTNVIQLRPHLHTPIGHVIRTGEMAHRQYEHLFAAGRLPAERVIVDASRAGSQKEFIRALQDVGTDVILDTKTAELSEIGRFRGMAKGAPWAAAMEGQPLGLRDFQPNANIDLFGQIARMAVEIDVAAVMSPTHFLRNGAEDFYLPIDLESVTHLRSALNREGGTDIAIDYPLILPHTRLQDRTHRTRLMGVLKGLPIDNLALRLSRVWPERRTAVSQEKPSPRSRTCTVSAIRSFSIISGAWSDWGALAFGVVSGIAHGIGERDRFDARKLAQASQRAGGRRDIRATDPHTAVRA